MLISICAGPSRSNWDLIAKLSSGQIAPRRPGERQLDSKNEETSKINRISQYTANNPRDINHLLSVTFCTQMTRTPACRPDQLLVGGDGAGFRHAGEAEIGGVGQHGGEDHALVVRRLIGPQMREAVAESSPNGHFVEKVGDADPRKKPVKPIGQHLGALRCYGLEGRDLE